MNEKIRVMLVDDHKIIRDGIAALLSKANEIEVVGAVSSGEEAVNEVENFAPNVILMDIMMKGMTGVEAARWIREQSPQVKVILLSMEVSKEYVSAGIQSGISGYLPKDVEGEKLIEAIRTVFSGGKYFDDAITGLIFDDYYKKEKRSQSKPGQKLPGGLSPRELEVLELIALGKTNREIAEQLFISVKTTESHKTNILSKLGLRNTAELVRYALENNLFP
jgi:DNA-binding NarL/FixJ family response regulator